MFSTKLTSIRERTARRLLEVLWTDPRIGAIKAEQQVALERELRNLQIGQEALKLLQEALVAKFLQKMASDSRETLASKLNAKQPLVRWLAVQVVSARRLAMEPELIDLLNDPDPTVRQPARQALYRLSRGTDFGPLPEWTKAKRDRAVARWHTWLALQKGATPDNVVVKDGQPDEDVSPPLPDLLPRGKFVPKEVTLQTTDEQVEELSDRLVAAAGKQQEEFLKHLKDSKGVAYTEALVLAIPRLTGPVQAEAREALAERLARMTAKTLKQYLGDDNPELRGAAALACAAKEEKDLLPDLITLLEDADERVPRAACAALKALTGQDLGPKPSASAAERRAAADRWRAWSRDHAQR